jgi:hypothetical protein
VVGGRLWQRGEASKGEGGVEIVVGEDAVKFSQNWVRLLVGPGIEVI